MKLNKSIAGLTPPDAGSVGFANQSSASTASGVIIIGFAEVEVYGLSGGTWSLLDTVEEAFSTTLPTVLFTCLITM